MVFTSIQPFTTTLIASNIDNFKYDWVWYKTNSTCGFLNAKKQPLRNHESILVFYSKQPTYNPQFTQGKPYSCKKGTETLNYNGDSKEQIITVSDGKRYPKTVQAFMYDKDKQHPTQKPLKLMEYLINTYTNENDLVLDPTMGSGTTCLAAKNLNRRYIGIEKEQKYYDIACKRLS